MPELLLASASPRRRDILHNLGMNFIIIPAPEIDETSILRNSSLKPHDIALKLAIEKSSAINPDHDQIALTADTIVAINDESLGKPSDESEAKIFLRKLSGQKHQVITALALKNHNSTIFNGIESTDVFFRKMAEDEIDWYVSSGEPFGKAGGYAIQGLGGIFIYRIDGCYFNVVGLPVFRLFELLHQSGYDYRDFITAGGES